MGRNYGVGVIVFRSRLLSPSSGQINLPSWQRQHIPLKYSLKTTHNIPEDRNCGVHPREDMKFQLPDFLTYRIAAARVVKQSSCFGT